jgi:hypothetical protein
VLLKVIEQRIADCCHCPLPIAAIAMKAGDEEDQTKRARTYLLL